MLDFVSLLDLTTNTTNCAGVDVPNAVFNLVHFVILIIQVVVPVLLIIWGMLDFAKGLVKSDEKEIKAGQKTFISRLIIAIMVFLIVTITRLVISFVGELSTDDTGVTEDSVWNCVDNMIKGVN